MGLVRYQGNEEAAKSFLFDVFYHKGNRNFVMLTVFFDVWPEIMFWTGTSSSKLNPLLETIIWAIYNTGPPNSLTELKVSASMICAILFFARMHTILKEKYLQNMG